MLLPPALGFSPHPPVSVYGTGAWQTIAAFLDRRGHMLHYFSSLHITASAHAQRICLPCDYPVCTGLSIPGPCFPSRVPTVLFTMRYRNINLLSIGYALSSLTLGPDLPRADQLYPGDLRYSATRIPTLSLATHSGILSS